MELMRVVRFTLLSLISIILAWQVSQTTAVSAAQGVVMDDWKAKSEEFWKNKLSAEEYKVCRRAGTERAFTGKYWNEHRSGIYTCVACGLELFTSDDKFDSGTGWPSYTKPLRATSVSEHVDRGLFMTRTEVRCVRCGSHLGHVFEDGPAPTGKRYCINSVCLRFEEKKPKSP